MLDLLIIGAGGFGREVHGWLWDCFSENEYRLKGFLDQQPRDLSDFGIEASVLADPLEYAPETGDRLLLAIGNLPARRRIVDALLEKGGQFASMVHPTAVIHPTAEVGRGAVIYPFAVISHQGRLGDYSHLSLYASIGHDAAVGDNCYLAPYATLGGFAVVEDDCYLATHATVAPLKRVGAGAQISANCPVLGDVPAGRLLHGPIPRPLPKLE